MRTHGIRPRTTQIQFLVCNLLGEFASLAIIAIVKLTLRENKADGGGGLIEDAYSLNNFAKQFQLLSLRSGNDFGS
jgi:hypothetical protein